MRLLPTLLLVAWSIFVPQFILSLHLNTLFYYIITAPLLIIGALIIQKIFEKSNSK